ncbi:uncharacterized protein LOC109856768 [Pseudomyrmex gracilis]|uniref:uncharacterized protein LOC109856768 n=1 Tax=Pseudomyrmex gracilis TaxID=219809 RepID=UPI000994AD09|nr:uncharacterized protein LOC109856768 [Pseudomyrmex gracilis]
MPRFEQTFVLICLLSGFVYVSGMDCSFGSSSNFIEKTLKSCPGILDSSDESYCCYDWNQHYRCCTLEDFGKNAATVIIPIVIGVLILVGLIGCCVCCLCCKCCPWYRRRHQGTVYGTIRTPIIQVIEQTNLPPRYPCSQPAQNQYVPFPTQSTGVAASPIVNEEYAKQAPYNPTYTAQ